jgi:hypothetical protein
MPFTRKLNACLPVGRLFVDVAGLLAWASLIAFPSRLGGTVAEVSATRMENKMETG